MLRRRLPRSELMRLLPVALVPDELPDPRHILEPQVVEVAGVLRIVDEVPDLGYQIHHGGRGEPDTKVEFIAGIIKNRSGRNKYDY